MSNERQETVADNVSANHQFSEVAKMIQREEVAVSKMETTTQTGNAAAMREALVDVYNTLEQLHPYALNITDISRRRAFRSMLCHAKNVIDITLSAPPRNCDRPECATTNAAQDVWSKEDGGKTAYYEWLFAEAKGYEK